MPAPERSRGEVLELVARRPPRREWSDDQKRMIVVEAIAPGVRPVDVMRRWGISSGMLYGWRRQVMAGELGAVPRPVPALAEVAIAETQATAVTAPDPPPPGRRSPLRQAQQRVHPRAHPHGARRALVEIALPGGAVVRVEEGIDGEALRRVLAAVAAALPA
ncbi:IS66-like element accessory protein TnpA [Craurococcus roseus]|uniref:IS66-like element accessory protein TnpA n=1 Tax=Craurococcus roseus TaxID=77585 RepID=UPI0031DF33FC